LLALWPTLAIAEARIGLVIGNQAYTGKVQALKNPHNDIKAVGKALEADGFKVTMVQDATRRQMWSAVQALGAQLAKAGPDALGFLYYSGHGVARPEDHANYLIPIDLKDTESTDFWFDAVKLDDILGELERAAPFAAHFVVFDACRDELNLPYRSASKGFEAVAERSGMFIAFATALGAVALDEVSGGRGPYASALAAELVKPGQDHLQLFQNVKEGVYAATGRRQVPWTRDGMLKRVYFASSGLMRSEPTSAATAAPPQTNKLNTRLDDSREIAVNETEGTGWARRKKEPKWSEPAGNDSRTSHGAAKVAVATTPTICEGVGTTVGNERKCLKPGDTFRDCPDCPEMVMGSNENENERPVHKVRIAKAFAVSKYSVTFTEWDACVSERGCLRKPGDQEWGRDSTSGD
jgi:hypothetical protein